MSFWSKLGKVLPIAGGVAAAPFTGGSSLIPTILAGAGGAISAGANQAAQNRGTEADFQTVQDSNRINAEQVYQSGVNQQAQMDLQRKLADEQAREAAYQSALRASFAKGFKPLARPEGVANYSFIGDGVTPEMIEAMEMRRAQGMDRMQNGLQFDPMAAPQRVTPTAQMPKAGTMEKLAGILGPGMSISGKVLEALRKQNEGK